MLLSQGCHGLVRQEQFRNKWRIGEEWFKHNSLVGQVIRAISSSTSRQMRAMYVGPERYHWLMDHPALKSVHAKLIGLTKGQTQHEAFTFRGRIVDLVGGGARCLSRSANTLCKKFAQVDECRSRVQMQCLRSIIEEILLTIREVAKRHIILTHLPQGIEGRLVDSQHFRHVNSLSTLR